MVREHVIYSSKKAAIRIQSEALSLGVGRLGMWHHHQETEIIYITKGSLLFHGEKEAWEAKAGDALVISPLSAHYGEVTTEGTVFMMVQFASLDTEEEHMQRLACFVTPNQNAIHFFASGTPEARYIKEHLDGIYAAAKKPASIGDYYLLAHKYSLIAYLREKAILADTDEILLGINVDAILPILSYIHQNYAKEFSLSDLAGALSFNKNYLCRLFKRVTGRTIVDYLNFYRIYTAEKLLREGKRATETALLTGFSSQAYFNRVFKKHLFLSPAEYRKQALFGNI